MAMHSTFSELITRFKRDEDGLALLEFAFVLPIMLILFGVTIEGTRMMWSYQAAATSVRDAARYLSILEDVGVGVCASGTPTRLTNYETMMQARIQANMAGPLIRPGSAQVTSVSLACQTSSFDLVQVTATVDITFPFGGLFRLVGENAPAGFTATIREQHRMLGT